ncbi:MAG: hypothetical protein KIT84_09225 [Labilithrix sp.]|nr:hypothetical protein [Labilithrix sp.]MCW5811181.1 hypothetical protein [Labilithrix sp.]
MKRALVAMVLALAACTDSLAIPEAPPGTLNIGLEGGCRGAGCGDPLPVAAETRLRVVATGTSAQSNLRAESNAPESAVVADQKVDCHDAVCDYAVDVDTKAPGVADITFTGPDGLVDLVRLDVK